jgi:cell division protein FtsL
MYFMQTKINQFKQKALFYVQRLGDMRFTGQLVFAIIVLLITWSGIKSIQTNYDLQKQISTLKQQIVVAQLQNNNLALQNSYLDSNQYLELAARQNFGLAAPGEKEIIVPQSVALSYTTNLPTTTPQVTANSQQPGYQKNFESWIDFFLHRQGDTN